VDAKDVKTEQHFTQPPPRYSEASLVKRMEELGIGRPSTYASILKVLQDRGYVTLDKRRFTPVDKGRMLVAFLENFFGKYVQYNYTADLEERLDKVSAGDLAWKKLLNDFWNEFSASVDETKDLRVTHVLDALNDALRPLVFPDKEDGTDPRKCMSCDDGELSLKLGKFGAFVEMFTIGMNDAVARIADKIANPGRGRSGGTVVKDLGKHPEDEKPVQIMSGRYGPYVKYEKVNATLPKGTEPADVTMEMALEYIAAKIAKGPAKKKLKKSKNKTFREADDLPGVMVIRVTGLDEHGDMVGEPEVWKQDGPKPKVIVREGPISKKSKGHNTATVGVGGRALCRIKKDNGMIIAQVMKRLGAGPSKNLGILYQGGRGWRIQPVDKKARHDYKPAKVPEGSENNDLVWFQSTRRNQGDLRLAEIVETVGSADGGKAASLISLYQHEIPVGFPDDVIADAKALKLPKLSKYREDLRHLPLVTIDPVDAKDFDDAITATP